MLSRGALYVWTVEVRTRTIGPYFQLLKAGVAAWGLGFKGYVSFPCCQGLSAKIVEA